MSVSRATQDDHDRKVGAALAEYDVRRAAGEGVHLLDFLAAHPDEMADLVWYFREVPPSPPAPPPPVAPAAPAAPSGIPGCVFERELGRGGMGVVNLMTQTALKRQVAVKTLLPDAVLTADRLTRFVDEARTAGGLKHPHIVPVYETGTHDGRPYYVMEYVAGETLQDVLSRGALDFKPTARLIARLAEAAHTAHAQNVVHRDLKPANVLLAHADAHAGRADAVQLGGTSGPRVIPKLADFGLAWSDANDRAVSRTGQVVGTPRYMAPEQAAGSPGGVTAAADVYALGAILYECLTGRAPFETADLSALLAEIRDKDPVPPGRLRDKTPRDLETICLTCLEKDPARRYPSARALADDLTHFLNDEPIVARPPSWVGVAGKWAKRRPAAAGLIAFGLVAAVAFAVTILAWNVSLTAERDQTAKQRDEKEKQRDETAKERDEKEKQRAEAAKERDEKEKERERTAKERDKARELLALAKGLDDYTARLSNDPRIRTKDLDGLRKELLVKVVENRVTLTKLAGDDPELRELSGKGYGQLAEITADIGAKADALPLYEKAVAAFEAMARDRPDVPGYRRALATTLDKQATLFRRIDRPADAEAGYRRAVGLWRDLADGPGGTPRDRQALAGVCGNLGHHLRESGRPDAADKSYRESLDLLEKLTADHPAYADFTRDLAATERHLGLALWHTGRAGEAEERMTRAREMGEGLVKAHPKGEEYKKHLGATLNNLAILFTDTGRPADAEKAYTRAVELVDDLAAAHPQVLAYRSDLSKAVNNLGTFHDDQGQCEKAEKAFARARDLRTRLVEADPDDTDFRHDLAGVLNNLGRLYAQLGRDADADAAYREAVRHRDILAKAKGPLVEQQVGRATVLLNAANLFDQTGKVKEAAATRAEALALLRAMVKDHPDHPEYAAELSKVLNGLGGAATDRGDWKAAQGHYEEVIRLREKLTADHPTVTDYRRLLGTAHNNFGRMYHLMKRYSDAEPEYKEAIKIDRELNKRLPAVVTHRRDLVLHLNNLATTYGVAGVLPKAEEAFKEALAVATALEKDFAPLPDDRLVRAGILNGLAVTYGRSGRRPLAEQTYRDAITIAEGLHTEFPQNAEYAASLGLKYGNMGERVESRIDPKPALDWHDKAVSLLKETLTAHPQHRNAREYLVLSYSKRAGFLGDLGRHADARTDWEAAVATAATDAKWRWQLELSICLGRLKEHAAATKLAAEVAGRPDLSGANLCDLATAFALSSKVAAGDDTLTDAKAVADGHAARAVELLAKAHEKGFFRAAPIADRVRTDPAFAPLRGRADFKQLMADIDRPKPPPGKDGR